MSTTLTSSSSRDVETAIADDNKSNSPVSDYKQAPSSSDQASSSTTTATAPTTSSSSSFSFSSCFDTVRARMRATLFCAITDLCSSSSSSSSRSGDDMSSTLGQQHDGIGDELQTIRAFSSSSINPWDHQQQQQPSLSSSFSPSRLDANKHMYPTQGNLASPFSVVDLLLIIVVFVNSALLAIYHPSSPADAVQRYVTSASSVNCSETELLVNAASERIVEFDRPSWVTGVEYAACSFFLLELLLRVVCFGWRFYASHPLRQIDVVISLMAFVSMILEAQGVLPSPSRWIGVSAMKLVVIPSIIFRAHLFPHGTEELFQNLGGAVRRSASVFFFFFVFIAACALIFMGLLTGEMKEKCVLDEWYNVSACFEHQGGGTNFSQRFVKPKDPFSSGNNNNNITSYTGNSDNNSLLLQCSTLPQLQFLQSFNLSDNFLGDIQNFVCGGIFDSTVLGKAPSLACSVEQVCVGRSAVGSETTGWRCPYGYACTRVGNLFSGSVGYDNYFQALFTTFVASSEKLWYILGPSAADSSMDVFFFVFVLFISLSVLLLNVTVVTLCMEYEKSLAAVDQKQQQQQQRLSLAAAAADAGSNSGGQSPSKGEAATTGGGGGGGGASSSPTSSDQQQLPLLLSSERREETKKNRGRGVSFANVVETAVQASSNKEKKDTEKNKNESIGDATATTQSVAATSTTTAVSILKASSPSPSASPSSSALEDLVYDTIGFPLFSCISGVLHMLVLCLYTNSMSDTQAQLLQIGDTLFVTVLGVEIIFRLAAGPRRFFTGLSGFCDVIVVGIAIIGFSMADGDLTNENAGLRCTRILRASRMGKCYYQKIQGYFAARFKWSVWRTPDRWYRALRRSVTSSLLLFFVLLTMVLVGALCMQHGGGGWLCHLRVKLRVVGKIRDDGGLLNNNNNNAAAGSGGALQQQQEQHGAAEEHDVADDIELYCPKATYESFGDAVLTLWQLVTGDDWDLLAFDAMQNIGQPYALVYVIFFVVGFVMLISLFASSILAAYLTEAERDLELEKDRLEKEEEQKKKMIQDENDNNNSGDDENDDDVDKENRDKTNSKRGGGGGGGKSRSKSQEEEEDVHPLLRSNGGDDDDDDDYGGGADFGGGSADFGASGVSQSVAIFETLESETKTNHASAAYKLRADRLLRRSVIADVGRSSLSAELMSTLEKERNAIRSQVRVDDDSQWDDANYAMAIASGGGGGGGVNNNNNNNNNNSGSGGSNLLSNDSRASSQSMTTSPSGSFGPPDISSASSGTYHLPETEQALRNRRKQQQQQQKKKKNHPNKDSAEAADAGGASDHQPPSSDENNNQQQHQEGIVSPTTPTPPSCYTRFSLQLRVMCDHPAFAMCYGLVTVMYVASQVMYSPIRAPDTTGSTVSFALDAAARALCVVEALWKLIAFGANPKDPGSYWNRSVWNVVEFTIAVVGVIGLGLRVAIPKSSSRIFLRGFDALFAFRPITIVRHSATMQIVIRSLFRSIRDLAEATFIMLLMLFLYAIAGTQLFSGWFRTCILDSGRGTVRYDLPLSNCTAAGGSWKNDGNSFDHVIHSLYSVFILVSREMWTESMRKAMDYGGLGQPSVRNNHFYSSIYFVIASLMSLVMTNVFMAVLVEAYNRCKRSAAAQVSLQTIREHNAWIRSEKRLAHVLPTVAHMAILEENYRRACGAGVVGDAIGGALGGGAAGMIGSSVGYAMDGSIRQGKKVLQQLWRMSAHAFDPHLGQQIGGNINDSGVFGSPSSASETSLESPRSGGQQSHSFFSLFGGRRSSDNNPDDENDHDDDNGGAGGGVVDEGGGGNANNISSSLRDRGSSTVLVSPRDYTDADGKIKTHYLLNTRHHLVNLANNQYVKHVFNAVTVWCVVSLLCIVDPMPVRMKQFLDLNEVVLCCVFWAEMLLLLAGSGWRVYLRNAWCRVDMVSALVALAMLLCRLLIADFPAKYRTISWFLRLGRLVKLAKGTEFRAIFVRFGDTLRSLSGVLALFLCFFFAFGCIASRLFGRVVWGPVGGYAPNHQNSFNGASLSCFYLLRLSLGGSWPKVWWTLRHKATGCDPDVGNCGPPSPLPELFFVIFVLTFTFILKNLLVAVAVDVFASSGDFRSLPKIDAQITVKLWMITQCGCQITNPAQLRALYTQRVPLNGRVLRFIRSLPPGFPTSPIWLWELQQDDDASSGGLSKNKNKNKNNNDYDDDDDDDDDNQQQQRNRPLLFKKRGLLEPAIIIRVIEVLYVAHCVRSRRESAQRLARAKAAAAAAAVAKKRRAASSRSNVNNDSLASQQQQQSLNNDNSSSGSIITSNPPSPAAATSGSGGAGSGGVASSLVRRVHSASTVFMKKLVGGDKTESAASSSRPKPVIDLDEAEAEAEADTRAKNSPSPPASSSSTSGGEDNNNNNNNQPASEATTHEKSSPPAEQDKTVEKKEQQEQQRRPTTTTGEENTKTESPPKKISPNRATTDETQESEKNRNRGQSRVRFAETKVVEETLGLAAAESLRLSTNENDDDSEGATKHVAQPAAASEAKTQHQPHRPPPTALSTDAVIQSSTSTSPTPLVSPVVQATTPPPPSSSASQSPPAVSENISNIVNNNNNNNVVTVTFAEVADVLFHMAFMAPFAPSQDDRVFNALDMHDIRLNSTEQDWEDATQFAFELWLSEMVGALWMRKVMLRRKAAAAAAASK